MNCNENFKVIATDIYNEVQLLDDNEEFTKNKLENEKKYQYDNEMLDHPYDISKGWGVSNQNSIWSKQFFKYHISDKQ